MNTHILLAPLVLTSTFLSGCLVLSQRDRSNQIEFSVVFRNEIHDYNSSPYNIIKITPQIKPYCKLSTRNNYLTWGNYRCDFKNHPKEKVEFFMTQVIPLNQMPKNGEIDYINNQLDILPPSAWRTYTIYPQQVIEQAKREKPVTELHSRGTRVTLILSIDEQGNISQEIEHERIIDDRFGT